MLWPSFGAATLLFLAWGAAPTAPVFSTVLSPSRLVAVASVAKLALLALSAHWSRRAWQTIDADNPVRPAWALLGLGMLANVLGQAALAPYQLTGRPTPFPSVADVFYTLAYPLIAAAFVAFVRAYEEAGYPMGSRAERIVLVAVTSLAGALMCVVVLRPVVEATMPPLEKALSAAYPVLDVVLLIPLALLLRTTSRFRGGSVGTAWFVVLAGFVFMCAGDVLFAYFTALGRTGLDPFVHAAYIVSYGFIAAGLGRHRGLIAS
jgi:hypothetical protein